MYYISSNQISLKILYGWRRKGRKRRKRMTRKGRKRKREKKT
jgi:hypothetical protein